MPSLSARTVFTGECLPVVSWKFRTEELRLKELQDYDVLGILKGRLPTEEHMHQGPRLGRTRVLQGLGSKYGAEYPKAGSH